MNSLAHAPLAQRPPLAWGQWAAILALVALALFAKSSPWTRGYLKGDVEAWNASGGVSSGDKLLFDEEVIVLVRRVSV